MKPLGPYVAVRELPGRTSSPVRTLRATDRLTGMPVLLHLLPAPQPVPVLPEHPNVLAPVDSVSSGDQAYVVTELPLQARPAQDAVLAARGALGALAALHERGVVHGGLSASQLWSVDGEVLLAGAGLPWGGHARPSDDLYALAVILQELGGLPEPLRPLLTDPGTLDAAGALRRLAAAPDVVRPPDPADHLPPQALPPAELLLSGLAQEAPPVSSAPPADISSSVPDPAAEATPRGRGGRPDRKRKARTGSREHNVPSEAPSAPLPSPPPEQTLPAGSPDTPAITPPGPHDGSPIVLGELPSREPTEQESPQERRRRENEARRAQAMLDAQAAAARRAVRLKAEQTAVSAPVVPAPLHIGFGDDLPEWEAPRTEAQATPGLQLRDVDRLPPSLRRVPAAEPTPEPALRPQPGALPSRRAPGEPIRIGWDEDDSWRVVREAPAAPARAPRRLPRIVLPLLAATLLLGGAIWALRSGALSPSPQGAQAAPSTGTPAIPGGSERCCEVQFTVRGAAGATARLSVEQAPQTARLAPGQPLGTAPGRVQFPVAGTYRVRVAVEGYAPASMSVSVPRAQPVTIDLSD